MKKILLFLNILLIGIIIFMASNPKSNAQAKSQFIDTCMVKFCRDYTNGRLNGMIDGLLLQSMTKNFANDRGKGFVTTTDRYGRMSYSKQRDGLSIVFDVEKIKTMIWQMQKNACDNHCDPTIQLGIRFYYIKYPANTGGLGSPSSLDNIESGLKNKHALVMVPVYKRKLDKYWYDYDLWGGRPGCFLKIDTATFTDPRFKTIGGIGADQGDNHGGVGPPPDPGTFPTNEFDQ